ncbi:MAG: TIGR03564 family F420-dependent LLM class oxidoreductase [Streptosporangiaceae bacterium]
MSFGISLQASPPAAALDGTDALRLVTDRAREAEATGVDDIWLNQGLDLDSVTVAALVAREVPRVVIGTAVVPMYYHHPVSLAGTAKAAQLAASGRFALGIGLGHQAQVEGVFGVPFDRPIRHLRDYLRALRTLLDTGTAGVHGPTLTADLTAVPAAAQRGGVTPRVPLLVAAMGPQALRATGELADGTLPYLAGPRSLESLIVPGITGAAAAAGRPAPQVAAGVPASVTAEPERARAHAFEALGGYARNPSYQAVLDREGITHASDLALIGDEQTVAAGIRRYLEAGATDIRISPAAFSTDEERLRTWRLVGELARQSVPHADAPSAR